MHYWTVENPPLDAGGGPINWPARSPDLNPPDFFLWGTIKGISRKATRENMMERIINAFE
ncbi:unnamed protein product, partial [Tenebrio molitor]